MRRLVWTSSFTRAAKRVIRRTPILQDRIADALRRLSEDPFQPRLRTHKLTGVLEGTWACSVTEDYRMLFDFVKDAKTSETEILLITIGTHDEVY